MKRYFTLLTFSLLASTAVVKAGYDFDKGNPSTASRKLKRLAEKVQIAPKDEEPLLKGQVDALQNYINAQREPDHSLKQALQDSAKTLYEDLQAERFPYKESRAPIKTFLADIIQYDPQTQSIMVASFLPTLTDDEKNYLIVKMLLNPDIINQELSVRKIRVESNPLYQALDESKKTYVNSVLFGDELNQQKQRYYNVVKPTANLQGLLVEEQRKYTEKKFELFDVGRDGDCLFYVLQKRREEVIGRVLAAGHGDQVQAKKIRDLFKGEILLLQQELEGLTEIEYERYIERYEVNETEFTLFLSQFLTPKKYTPPAIALAYGILENKKVHLWTYSQVEGGLSLNFLNEEGDEDLHIKYGADHYQILIEEGKPTEKAEAIERSAFKYNVALMSGADGDENSLFLRSPHSSWNKNFDRLQAYHHALGRIEIYRSGVGNSRQYGINMPHMPVLHPYHISSEENARKNAGLPNFLYGARLETLSLLDLPNGIEVIRMLEQKGIAPERVELFIDVQDDSWKNTVRLLRPQSWIWPDAPFEFAKDIFHEERHIEAAIFSDSGLQLIDPKTGQPKSNGEFVSDTVSVHNFLKPILNSDKQVIGYEKKKNDQGQDVYVVEDPSIVSSSDTLGISGIKDNKTNVFYSIISDLYNKKVAVTLHALLSDKDLDSLIKKPPVKISDLIASVESFTKGKEDLSSSIMVNPNGKITRNGKVLESKRTLPGNVESITIGNGILKLNGWAADTEKGGASETVTIVYKGKVIGSTGVDQPRDLNSHFGGYNVPGNYSQVGFGGTFPLPESNDPNFDPSDLKVISMNKEGDVNFLYVPQTGENAISIGQKGEILSEKGSVFEIKKTVRGDAIQGNVESITVDQTHRKLTLSGWSADVGQGKATQKVSVFYKHKFIGEGLVGQPSASIVGHYGHYGIPGNYAQSGFNFTIDFPWWMTSINPDDIQVVGFGEEGDANFVYVDKKKIEIK